MRIDAHHHFWELDRFDYVWMTPQLEVLNQNFGPQDLAPHLQAHAIDRSVLVQTVSNIDETRWFLQLSEQNASIAGVVGWVDLTACDVAKQLKELQAAPGRLVGIRHQVHDETDNQWLLREDVQQGLAAISDSGLCYDLLIRPEHFPAAVQVTKQFSDLRFAIDHIAKPAIATHDNWNRWAQGIAQLAACPNVSCKLSGMITEANWDNWKPSDLSRYTKYLLDCFGPHRLMFGSDWPVCLLAGTYDSVVDALTQNITNLSETEQAQIFGNTAIDFYQLEQTS